MACTCDSAITLAPSGAGVVSAGFTSTNTILISVRIIFSIFHNGYELNSFKQWGVPPRPEGPGGC